jgi:cation diffusion facilitator family transporter
VISLTKAFDWLGFGGHGHSHGQGHGGHGHSHGADGHGHTHGVIDPSIVTTERGIWAIKWSFAILALTAALQLVVVFVSGSVALLADTIHNIGDATTAIPLWVAFVLARRKPSRTFPYGLGRVEDLAGIIIVLIILFSAIVAGYEAIDRLIHPHPVTELGWLTAAGIIGFLGNEAVAVFRIRVGRQMNSAALIADGYHARTDGLTSLAVVLGALGVWLGFPLADPIIGLLITAAIFGIVWQSAQAVITRTLDGVEPEITDEIRHAAKHVPGVLAVRDAKARWIGHKLHAEVAIAVDPTLSVAAASEIAAALERELHAHLPALAAASIQFGWLEGAARPDVHTQGEHGHGEPAHHHAPEPFRFRSKLAEGVLEIVDTPQGERMRLTLGEHRHGLTATVVIDRPGGEIETLPLAAVPNDHHCFQSSVAPAEPHEFSAELHLVADGRTDVLPFRMVEPAGHRH